MSNLVVVYDFLFHTSDPNSSGAGVVLDETEAGAEAQVRKMVTDQRPDLEITEIRIVISNMTVDEYRADQARQTN